MNKKQLRSSRKRSQQKGITRRNLQQCAFYGSLALQKKIEKIIAASRRFSTPENTDGTAV